MNILLVDDDNLVLKELKDCIDWEQLGFEKLFVASCCQEAQKVLSTVPVHVMLCDIEMPGGSGLELLEWVRGRGYGVQCVFLTNYSDFSYARQAMRLESLEYLLKPINREKVKEAVLYAMQRARKQEQDEQARSYWLDTGKEAKDIFWSQYLLGQITQREESFRRLGYTTEDRYILAAVKTASLAEVEKLWGADMFEYVLKNVLFELLDTPYFQAESVFPTPEKIWVIVCRFGSEIIPDSGALEGAMQNVTEACEKKLHLKVPAAIGSVCTERELVRELTAMREMMENVLNAGKHILRLEDYQPSSYCYVTPDVTIWEGFFHTGQKEEFTADIRRYLLKKTKEGLSKQDILAFRQDVTQMVYSFLREAGIAAYKLFAEPEAEVLYQRACNSVEDMCTYCEFMADRVISYKKFTEEPASIMETILNYVDEHYCEEISRNDLVNLVYISPDYCSRLFTKETGRSLKQYVTEKRMEKAKRLLMSDLPVKGVALEVGYTNFSYFSKAFREMAGISPMEYREQERDNQRRKKE